MVWRKRQTITLYYTGIHIGNDMWELEELRRVDILGVVAAMTQQSDKGRWERLVGSDIFMKLQSRNISCQFAAGVSTVIVREAYVGFRANVKYGW